MTGKEQADLYERRAANLAYLLKTAGHTTRHVFDAAFKDALDEIKVAVGILRDSHTKVGEDDLYVGPVAHRYLVLPWVEYDNQVDEVNPDDSETGTSDLESARLIVEEHVFQEARPDYTYRCVVYDLDEKKELDWHAVQEIRWGDRPRKG
jgi:hypothetical protein